MPVSAASAKTLIQRARPAPYGRGEETIVDLSVRRVWQLEPAQFSLRNSHWKSFLADIVTAVKGDFGIDRDVEAHLYKLLIYETGSFFKPHRDTEKTKGMFATLIICLPSRHAGGTLEISHDGVIETIDCGGPRAEFEVRYAAFYADCRHEIKPVTRGYRICLVYTLAVAGRKRQPAAPENSAAVGKVAALLPVLFRDDSRSKAAFLLKHQYSESGLDPAALKGSDRALLDVLARAAARLDYTIHLALLTHHQEGSLDWSTWDGGGHGYGRRHYRYDDFEDDDFEFDESAGESGGESFEEVFDESLVLDHWRDPSGRKRRLGKISLEERELFSSVEEDDRPHEQAIHEATGNEGATMERWYRLGAVVLWPRAGYTRILAAEGPESAVPALEAMIAKARGAAAKETCRSFAEAIVARWRKQAAPAAAKSSLCARMLKILETLADPALAARFIRETLPGSANGSEGPALVRLLNRFGWRANAEALRFFLSAQKPGYGSHVSAPARIFEALCCNPPGFTEERRAVCAGLTDEFDRVVERFDDARGYEWDRESSRRDTVIVSMFRICGALDDPARLDRFVTRSLAHEDRYPLRRALAPAVKTLRTMVDAQSPAIAAYRRVRAYYLEALRELTAAPVAPPESWKREAAIACPCRDCRELVRFLEDPVEQVHHFPVGKQRRKHLHRQIDAHGCDVTHVTDRRRQETLVCRKTRKSYDRRRAQYESDLRLLDELAAGI